MIFTHPNGKPYLGHRGHVYQLRTERNTRQYWRCTVPQCFAVAITNKEGVLIREGSHEHPPPVDDNAMDCT